MAAEVVMPRLGWNMEEGSVAAWRKKSGDTVKAGEVLFDVESDKATQEVEAQESGILHIPAESPPAGTSVPVGTILAWLLKPGESAPAGRTMSPPPPTPSVPKGPAPVPAAARGAQAAPATGLAPAAGGRRRPAISPRAKRAARELHVDWSGLRGSGSTGRIVERDVRAAAASGRHTAGARGQGAEHVLIAMMSTEADATDLVRLRKQLDAKTVPASTVLVLRLSAQALKEHPALNARLEAGGYVRSDSVDIAVALPTEEGLPCPVIRDAASKHLRQIEREAADLVDRARGGALGPGDLAGATFVVLDLGAQEIDTFTPVLPLAGPAALGVGRLVAKQVVTDPEHGTLAIRWRVVLSLAFDQRLTDAGAAARFLQSVKRYVENPYLCLVGA